jgi:hypothetical protein
MAGSIEGLDCDGRADIQLSCFVNGLILASNRGRGPARALPIL